jgi:ABC-type uncharacterized transport system substrate-binding protein
MNRREVVAALTLPLVPVIAQGQQAATPTVGFLSLRPYQEAAASALQHGLRDMGYVEGASVTVLYRWADGQPDRLRAHATDLVARNVNVIVADSSPATLAAKAATASIPIVFSLATDPVALGLVAGLNRPGGNLTGVMTLSSELAPKGMELLHELIPAATVFALMIDPTNPDSAEATAAEVETAARTLGLELHVLKAESERDFEAVFAALERLRAGGLIIGGHAAIRSRAEHLAALAIKHAMPAVAWRREFAVAGGLMSHGTDRLAAWRTSGLYAGRILKGARPAELPVERQSKIELIINLKTAKTLGIAIPQTLLARADEVIE